MTGGVNPAAEMHQWGVLNRLLPVSSANSITRVGEDVLRGAAES